VRSANPSRQAALALAAVTVLAACSGGASAAPSSGASAAPSSGASAAPTADALAGEILIDGSSTVYPVTAAVAEEFQLEHPGVRVSVAFSGTGGGFKKFCSTGADATDANDASRAIKAEELELCTAAGVEPVELKVAYDGLSVVVNPANDFVDCLTTEQLKLIWDQGSTVRTWADVDPTWPAETIELFGPGADSGTFDYFTEEINGEAKRSRADYTPSEDDNALVLGVANEENALGYFGFAYYEENADKLKLVAVDEGAGCVTPSIDTIKDGSYSPLSRPLFVYPSIQSLARAEVAAFFAYYLDNADDFVAEVGYVPLPDDELAAAVAALEAALP
jgi:phosphate transport system substrate-binding protein